MKIRDENIYKLGRTFLAEKIQKKGKSVDIIEKHLNSGGNYETIEDFYYGLIVSAANRERMWNVIKSPIGEISNLEQLLFGFDPKKVIAKYGQNNKLLLNHISKKFNFKYNDRNSGLWVQYSKSILSGANYLSKFSDYDDFDNYVKFFHEDERAKNALPLLLKEQIHGFGFALACDFLKEAGYQKFGKPDVHLKKIFKGTGLSNSITDFDTLLAIERVAKNTNETPYRIDKLFWLIGSGKFYLEKDGIGKIFSIGRNADKFIEYTKEKL